MTVPDSRAIVERFLAAAAAHDHDTLQALAVPDLRVSEAASLPFGGEHVGLDAFRRLERQVFGLWAGTRLVVDHMIGDGEIVVVLARLQGRSRVDGSAFEMSVAEVWELHDGRICSIRPYYHDTHRLLQVLSRTTTGGIDDIT